MKKLLLLFAFLILACSSDDSNNNDNNTETFLERYDGVVWENQCCGIRYTFFTNPARFEYTPQVEFNQFDCETTYFEIENENGVFLEILENYQNQLTFINYGIDTFTTHYITASEDGNNLNEQLEFWNSGEIESIWEGCVLRTNLVETCY